MRAGFVYETEITFGECDPAGILYYPRYFDLFHRAMEAWFESGLGLRYVDLVQGGGVGFPAVHTEADFAHPSRFGDVLCVRQDLVRVGARSLTFEYEVRGRDDAQSDPVRATGCTVCVLVDLVASRNGGRVQSCEMPDDLRVAITRFVEQNDRAGQ